MRRPRSRASSTFMLAACLLVQATCTTSARADDPTRKAAAQQLFDEALKLLDQGKFAEACPKLARSHDLAPSGGTLLNLGDCYEKNGQFASAWASFREAGSRAATAGVKAAESAANERANKLEPKLLRLRVTLAPGAQDESLEIRRDGVRLKRAELDLAVPVDPGDHKIEAKAFRKKPWSTVITLSARATSAEVVIPQLEPETSDVVSTSPSAPTETSASSWTTQRAIGVGVAGAGLVALGAGVVFGLAAISTNDEALSNCRDVDGTSRCNPTGLELTDDARTQALVSTILLPAGLVATGVGAYLYFSAPNKQVALSAAPLFGRGGTGMSLAGRF